MTGKKKRKKPRLEYVKRGGGKSSTQARTSRGDLVKKKKLRAAFPEKKRQKKYGGQGIPRGKEGERGKNLAK